MKRAVNTPAAVPAIGTVNTQPANDISYSADHIPKKGKGGKKERKRLTKDPSERFPVQTSPS
jgi:hypothetical protein